MAKEAENVMKRIIENVEKVIIGKRYSIELSMISLLCRGHVLIEDVPGTGKTSLAAALAKSLSCSFQRIQFTPDIMPSDVVGFSMFSPKTQEFEYHRGVIFNNILLVDEINRTSPKTQSSLLEAMEEKQVSVDGVTYKLDEPFMVLATQNPVENFGVYPLPEAQMDRFLMRISLGYPNFKEESSMITRFNAKSPLATLTPVASVADVLGMQRAVEQIYVDEKINDYVVALVTHTRNNEFVALGASPRASINLCKAAQAWALYNQRNYVLPDDVIKMSPHVLSHRIMLKQESKLKKITQVNIVEMALNGTKVPSA